MSDARLKPASGQKQVQDFTRHLLTDIKALERMLEDGLFELDVTRIGAEQELCLIDQNWKPAPLAEKVMDILDDPHYTYELAKFNLEINLEPREFKGDCLYQMEQELTQQYKKIEAAAEQVGAQTILTGILPTIRKFDLELDNLTPKERYYALVKAINKLRGEVYELRLRGMDELIVKHDSPLLEACNTGFQVHLQVRPDDYVNMYNIAQAITGPVLSACTNSPLMFGKRTWKETRVALFQQSVDTRNTSHHLRETSPRVTFGNDWMRKSILDIYQEDIMRYRVLLSSEIREDVLKKVSQGEAPELAALKIHNSTVYRWNRPCYGISNGKAHLRIENRVLPAGPSIRDEMANAAFWLGALNGMQYEVEDITQKLEFDDAKANFIAAARLGLDTKLTWLNGTKMSAATLILEELIPIAEEGLKKVGVDSEDVMIYLDVIRERVESGMTGSNWMLQSFSQLNKVTRKDELLATLTASIVQQQKTGEPVHKWQLANMADMAEWEPTTMLVEEFMTTDLFTVQKDDIIELVAEMMNWRRIRYVPVEDDKGNLVGLMTSRGLLKHYVADDDQDKKDGKPAKKKKTVAVKSLMINNPMTISPEIPIIEAMEIMDKYQIGCLPVVKSGKLVGVITEQTFLDITNRLLKRIYRKQNIHPKI